MTPAQLYTRKPERQSHAVGRLNGFYYSHVPELKDDVLPYEDPGKRVELRFYKDFSFDGRRIWTLASIWFDGAPFMIIQNAGREGDDHYRRFITDLDAYLAATRYLKSICTIPDLIHEDVVKLDAEITGLTDFYGNRLDGHFEMF
jgi:hypothetical protein